MPAFLTGILGFSRRDNHPDGIGAPYLPSGFCFALARTLEDVRKSRKSKTNMSLRHSSMALFICIGEERDGNPHPLTMAINDPGQNR
jgi:hypothetical protein